MSAVPTPTPADELSPREAAMLAGVSRATILNWIRDGRLDATRRPNGYRLILRENLQRLLDRADAA